MGKYCAKITKVKWANFVLCSCEVSVEAQEKVCTKIHSFSNHISLEKRALFLQTFVTKFKFVLISSYCSGH